MKTVPPPIHRRAALTLAAVLLSLPLSAALGRTWTDAAGKNTVEAELIGYDNGMVQLRKPNGETLSVSLGKFCAADQQFVKQYIARGGQEEKPSAAAETTAETTAKPDELVVEFLTGAKSHGRLIARDEESISFEILIGSRTYSRKYPLDRLHAITVGGHREVLNPMPGAGGSSGSHHGGGHHGGPPIDTGTVSGTGAAATSSGISRTRAQVESLIDRLGRTPPEWWDSVPLDYPQSLDLKWPMPPPGGQWNSQKNMGQYIWDVINPNPTKWKSGVRLMHHLLSVHKDRPEKQVQVMNSLGRMYQNLLGDYARAAFWWRKAGVDRDMQSPRGINLALCYWKLGNKKMAVDLLGRLPVYFSAVKLLADMGETETALRYAEAGARGDSADIAYLYAGDACRVVGQYSKAIAYYEKCLHVQPAGRAANRIQRSHQRARANIEGIKLFDTLDLRRVADGTYRSSSHGYVGPVYVEVVARSGRIESVKVTQHKEKQFFSSITETPRKIVEKQGVKGVDATSNATITSEAIINATAKALAGGMRE